MERYRQRLEGLGRKAIDTLARVNRRLGGIPLLLKQTFDSYNAHDGIFLSAAMAYFFFLTLFPLVLALIAIGSLFLEPEQARAAVIDFISQVLPIFEETIARNIDLVLQQRGPIGVVAALGFVYAASGLFGVVLAAVNRVWQCPAARPSYVQRLLAIALVLVFAVFLFLVSLAPAALQALAELSERLVDVGPQNLATVYRAFTLLGSVVLVVALFVILYWRLPATQVYFADAWPAAVPAGITFEAARQLYAWYLSRFTDFTLVYGSLAAIIGLLVWLNLSGFIILLGAELSAQIAERRGRGPSACAV